MEPDCSSLLFETLFLLTCGVLIQVNCEQVHTGKSEPGGHHRRMERASREPPEIDEATCFRISRKAVMRDGGVYTAYMCFWDQRAALCSALPLQACEGCNNAGLNYREQLGG